MTTTENANNDPVKTKVKTAPDGGGAENQDDADDQFDEGWDEKTRAYVKKLRDENKTRRLETKDLREKHAKIEGDFNHITGKLKTVLGGGEDDEDMDPTTKIELLTQHLEAREAELQFVKHSLSLGITSDEDQDYFQFLLNRHMKDKEDGYELEDDELDAIVTQVKGHSKSAGANLSGGTSFGGSKTPSPKETSSQVTLDQFKAMGITEKSVLYGKNPDLYNTLMAQLKKR